MVESGNLHGGNARRGSGRLGKPEEAPQESRLSGRHIKPAQKLPQTGSDSFDPEDQGAPRPPAALAVDIALEEAPPAPTPPVSPSPAPRPQMPSTQKPSPPQTIDSDTRYLIKDDAEKVRESRRRLKPAMPNEHSVLTQSPTDQLPPVGTKRPSNRNHPAPCAVHNEPEAPDSGRLRLMAGFSASSRPALPLTQRVAKTLAGKGQFEKELLPLRGGKTAVRLHLDLAEKHWCSIEVLHSAGKDLQRLTLLYRAPRESAQPGLTGLENAFDAAQIQDHNTHRDSILHYAIPDAEANWTHLRRWVQRAADGSLLGRMGLWWVKTVHRIATFVTHRSTLAGYLNALCELSREELDARKATRLVLAQGLDWNEKQGAPPELLAAQAQLVGAYDELIARWNAAYVCSRLLAQQYDLLPAEDRPAEKAGKTRPATA